MLPSRQFLTITHSIDAGSWFPPRHRNRVDHAASPGRVGEQVFDRTAATRSAFCRRDRWQRTASVIRAGEPPCATVFLPLRSRLCWLSLALLALLRGLGRIGPADFGSE